MGKEREKNIIKQIMKGSTVLPLSRVATRDCTPHAPKEVVPLEAGPQVLPELGAPEVLPHSPAVPRSHRLS